MALAISSYDRLPALADAEGLLNLAWTLDERAFLSVDLAEVLRRELADEAREGQPFLNSYFVQDPYGEDVLRAAVAAFFSPASWRCSITCGAGVNSLLHALAGLAGGHPAYVIGDAYPDFPHWVEQSGAQCLSRHGLRAGASHVENVRDTGVSVVLVERPALTGEQMDLEQLRELCHAVEPCGAAVVVDESYANYYPPSFSAVNIVSDVRNLAVLRGLSKAYWLGGLRLGYCVASEALTERVRAVVPPMLASSLSLRFARAVLELGDITRPLRARVPAALSEMKALLGGAGFTEATASCEFVPYVFCRGNDFDAQQRLKSHGILGKSQPFWSESARSVTYKYRLSVPLSPERMGLLRSKLDGAGAMPT